MNRIPTHTLADAPTASRPILEKILQASPTNRLLNLHAQMAHAPAVLAGYASLRALTAEHGTFGPKVGAALNLAIATAAHFDYLVGILSRVAFMQGWSEAQIAALRAGTAMGDAEIDALIRVVSEAATNSGKVTDNTWTAARQSWNDAQLAEAFAHVGLTVFTGYFLNYAQTLPDA